jgi:hypothetical protein
VKTSAQFSSDFDLLWCIFQNNCVGILSFAQASLWILKSKFELWKLKKKGGGGECQVSTKKLGPFEC